jgi:hypothetical protein
LRIERLASQGATTLPPERVYCVAIGVVSCKWMDSVDISNSATFRGEFDFTWVVTHDENKPNGIIGASVPWGIQKSGRLRLCACGFATGATYFSAEERWSVLPLPLPLPFFFLGGRSITGALLPFSQKADRVRIMAV